jgi:hypothetical protein
MACATAEGAFAHRAGPALPSYLALHRAGFSVPPVLPPERWALTPPFHPCQTMRAFRRRPAGFPARCHRAALRRRSILCGTFRSAVVAASLARHLQLRPLALPGALPCQEFRQPLRSRHSGDRKMTSVPQDGVRTFLPFQLCSGGFTPPLLRRNQRSPGPPARYIISRRSTPALAF